MVKNKNILDLNIMSSRTKINTKIYEGNNEEQQKFLNSENVNFHSLNEDEIEWVQSQRLYYILGHIGIWQILWCFLLSTFQSVSTFHIFTFVFQVSSVLVCM